MADVRVGDAMLNCCHLPTPSVPRIEVSDLPQRSLLYMHGGGRVETRTAIPRNEARPVFPPSLLAFGGESQAQGPFGFLPHWAFRKQLLTRNTKEVPMQSLKIARCSIVLSLAFILSIQFTTSEAIELRMNEFLPKTHFFTLTVRNWADQVATVTDGRVTIISTPSPLGPPHTNYQMAVSGIADITTGLHGYTPGVFPLSEMVQLPLLTKDSETNSVAYWRVYKKFFEPAGMHKGVHTLTLHVHPKGLLSNSKREIKSIDDFRGMKIRIPNPTIASLVEGMGAIPISAPLPTVFELISKGVVDGFALDAGAANDFRLVQFVKYATEIPGGMYNSSFFIVMNQRKWDAISKQDQEAIMTISGESLAAKIGRAYDNGDVVGLQAMRDAGVTFTKAEGPFLDDLTQRIEVLTKDWLEQAKKAGVDGEAALKMYRDIVSGQQ